jgi:nitroreductase
MTATGLIDRRYSCRTYAPEQITAEHRAALEAFMATRTRGPLGSAARYRLIAAAPDDGEALRRLGTYGFIKGATGFFVGAVRTGPGDLEDYGYLLEEIVLEATRLGLGTCWLGGTFTRGAFTSRFGGVSREETIPAVISTGYPGDGDGGAERIRQREHGDRRFPPGELFFDGEWMQPLELGADGAGADGYDRALHAVRMAPSATNRQPWRIVRRGRDWHFFLARTKGYGKGSLAFKLLRIADLQRVDLGIAMCHFELAAREAGRAGAWRVDDPGVALPASTIEYVATWRDES